MGIPGKSISDIFFKSYCPWVNREWTQLDSEKYKLCGLKKISECSQLLDAAQSEFFEKNTVKPK